MKILQIYKDYYPPVVGGIEKHINLLSTSLQKRGHEIEVLVSNINHNYSAETIYGIKVFKAPEWGRFLSAPLNPTFPYLIRKIGSSADILHFHLPNPTAVIGYLLSGLKKPVIVTYHSDIVRQRRMSTFFTPILEFFLKNSTHCIVATSPQYKASSRILRKFHYKCNVIPLGIDPDFFSKFSISIKQIETLKSQYGPRIILFVGKFRYYKGLSILVEAMRHIDGKLLLVGNGPCEKDIIQLINKFGLQQKIALLNELSDQKLFEIFQVCDVFVLPSIQKSEAFGIVLLEAMLNKKPVISTNLGTGTSYINRHDETGFVVEPGNPEQLANAINILLSTPELRAKFGDNGRKRVLQNFTSNTMIEKIYELYSEIYRPY